MLRRGQGAALAGITADPVQEQVDLGGREEIAVTPRRTATAAVSDLSAALDRWRAVLASMTNERLDEPLAEGRHAAATMAGYVMNMLDEFTHHGAELGVLRDLYAHAHRPDPLDADPPNLAEVA